MQPAPTKGYITSEAPPGGRVGRGEKPSESRDDWKGFYGRLRDLRAVAQSLRSFAAELQERTAAIADPESRRQEILASLEEGIPVLEHDRRQIEIRFAEIREILERDDDVYSACGDVIARLEASWEEALTSWPLGRDIEEYIAQISRRLPKLVTSLDAIIYDCGLLSLPSRISEHLELLPIGGTLNLKDAYEDELPKPEDRQRFLRYLSLYPGFVQGLVDTDSGFIFRADQRGWRRALSLLGTLVLALAGFLVIEVALWAGESFHLVEWPFTQARSGELLSAYLFLLLGAVGHIVVNLLKQDRAGTGSTRGLSDWLLRIHVKETSFWISAGSLALAPLAMAFLFDKVDWKTAFFFGYSYDSFLDLFLQRFQGLVSSAAETMKKKA